MGAVFGKWVLRGISFLLPVAPTAKARDILWAYTSVELYELLVISREWTIRRFRDFMTQALSAALLDD